MRRDRQRALIDLERVFFLAARLEDGRHPHERAEVVGLALERLRNVGHRAVIVVVEVTRGRAGVPAFRPIRQEGDRLVEDRERVGIVLDPDRLPRAMKQKIAGVRAGFGVSMEKPANDAGSLVRVLGGGEPRVEIRPLLGRRLRRRLGLFRLRRRGVRLGVGRR